MIDRHQARILAMQSLCQLDALGDEFLAQLDDFLAEGEAAPKVQEYARRLVHHARDRREQLDAALQSVAANWELKRMATVDRNILRVAACELATSAGIPPKVVISEAVEIAKAFGTAESPGFINGILDAVVKKRLFASGVDGSSDDSPPTDVTDSIARNTAPQ